MIITLSLFLVKEVAAREIGDIQVQDAMGRSSELSHFTKGESLLILGFFQCRHMCDFIVQNLSSRFNKFKHHPRVNFISIDEKETPHDALMMKRRMKGANKDHWNFLTTSKEGIRELTEDLDFSWERDPASGIITHESASYILRDGKFMRKLPGFDIKEGDLNLSRPQGKFFDFKQFCSAFDPSRSKYGVLVMQSLTVISTVFLLILGFIFLKLKKRSLKT